jgi:threonine/homoserine/homoserine lactone efflux protein
MTFELILAFAAYAVVTSITPGPNNTMLLASGANFGFRAALPHLLGISFGFAAMVLAVGVGIGAVFQALPILQTALRYVGAAYLLYLAWKIASSRPPGSGAGQGRPLTFLQAAAFQWVNVKAWIIALGAVATYTRPEGYFGNLVIVTVIFAAVGAPCIAAWAGAGSALRGFLSDPVRLRVFNIEMALLLVISLYPVLFEAG